jgi:hypothetical protein
LQFIAHTLPVVGAARGVHLVLKFFEVACHTFKRSLTVV